MPIVMIVRMILIMKQQSRCNNNNDNDQRQFRSLYTSELQTLKSSDESEMIRLFESELR